MRKNLILICLMAPFLFACSAAHPYTKAEGADILNKMNGNGKKKLFFSLPPTNAFVKMMETGGDPFDVKTYHCSVDGNDIGSMQLGEYLVYPVTKGQHELSCYKKNSIFLFIARKFEGKDSISVDNSDVYVQVNLGELMSGSKWTISKTPPDQFDTFELAGSCTACTK